MFKKLLIALVLATSLSAPLLIAAPTFADKTEEQQPETTGSETGTGTGSGSLVDGTCNYFLGLTSWNCGVKINDGESLKSGIWQIAINIAADISVLSAYLILGYVIYGGYLYTFSGGDPAKVASGKKTLTNAFLGLAIVLSANLIMSTIRFVFFRGESNLGDCITAEGCLAPETIFDNTISWIIGIAGVVSAIFVVYGGISYITSAGDPGKLAKAKQMILYALIGLAVVGLAQIITSFVTSMIRNSASSEGYYTNSIINPTIPKEVYEKQIN